MSHDLILGTAGHIDHGKTSLIGALTGTDTDRLPEEKKRGITIELGYAQLDLDPFRFGVVDVPGHEKFIRQMLAGATGMDLVMLVVAGDDSVKQQTTEHLDILRLLDLPAGVIAITKCDLCDPDWLDLVEEEIRQLVAGTFLAKAPIVRTSAKTGAGIEELKGVLRQAAEGIVQQESDQRSALPFRMAVDRSFSIQGHGTVVTGSVASGQVEIGDQLELQPGGVSVRLRGIQNHLNSAPTAQFGQRAAINLAGVKHDEVGRGQELAAEGYLRPSTLMTVRLVQLQQAATPLKNRDRIRFHIGTAERMGNVRLLDRDELLPGESALAQIYLSQLTVATWNQPFVIRQQSPMETIGGGRVLVPVAERLKKPSVEDLRTLELLESEDEKQRAAASVYFSQPQTWRPQLLTADAGVANPGQVAQELLDAGELQTIAISLSRSVRMHRGRLEQLGQRVLKSLQRMHEAAPLRFQHPRPALEREYDYLQPPQLLAWVIEHLKSEKKVVANVHSVGLVGYGPKLSKGQKQLLGQLIEDVRAGGIEAPMLPELIKAAAKNKDSVPELLEMAAENGDLVKIDDEYFLHADVMKQVKTELESSLSQGPGLSMSEIRQQLGTSRKYAIPILEYLDASGFTIRDGDLRRLAPDQVPSS